LHPSILLKKTKFVVSNLYSTIFGDAHSLGIPTVEYAYYPEYIKKDVGNKSIFPEYVDWFIYDDVKKFKIVASNLVKQDFKYDNIKIVNNEKQKDPLLQDFCN